MSGTIKLAWRYIAYHKIKTLILVACIFLATFLPIAVRIILAQFNEQIVARAKATPVVVGGQGSRLELALNSLYFVIPGTAMENTKPVAYGLSRTIGEKDWGQAIPLYFRHTASGQAVGDAAIPYPIVGTSVDYFEFRELSCAEGNFFSILGDCVLGANVAKRLGLHPGDRLASDAENVLDISGTYPLNMLVRGVLAESKSPDDDAVFVDLKTAWIIEDLGHGHQDAETLAEESRMATEGNRITTNRAVSTYTEINESNIASFHFHGDIGEFPITSFIAIPKDEKSETLMLAYFESELDATQMVFPIEEVRRLMGLVFQVETFFRAGAILIGISTLLLLVLVVSLSLRLRQREMETMYKIGCSRSTIVTMQLWELLFVFALAALLLSIAIPTVAGQAGRILQNLLVNGG